MNKPEDQATPEHRYKFARRWERKRELRSTKRMWRFIALDLLLLGIIVALTWMLVQQLD